MEKLNSLTKRLNKIYQLSNKILRQALPYLSELDSEDNDLVVTLQEKASIDPKMALELLRQVSLEIINVAEKTSKEIDSFSECIIQGESSLLENEDKHPFLLEVWFGDYYEEYHNTGLDKLIEDLEDNLSKINEDDIISLALAKVVST